ncbi:transcriptional regulator [Paenibacillus nanensis]|uniref:Transcriptional regulator n=1 Tax=Paenibacillus nanensis TaxID=393251 RepID=A0A3A1VIN3_9BACL|nr:WYL domain-containing protein [Paenibacillus nanensis]RIX60357.1 transcriptional regulator [Paenibacillus nanensis]
MSNLHRIGWFDQQVRAGAYPNSSRLAKHFEISQRQAARDIEYMVTSLRAPLQYVAKHRGYCYADDAFVLPHLYMTDEEKRVLKYLAHRYRHYHYDHSEQVQRVADLLSRFEGEDMHGDPGLERLPIFDADPVMMQHLELISRAITENRSLHLIYKDQNGERNLHGSPIKFYSRYHADYVLLYTDSGEQPVSLRLDGIIRLSIGGPASIANTGMNDTESQGRKPVRAPYLAKVKLKAPLSGDSWQGYRIQMREELFYTVIFYDMDSFLQHLLVADWEELLAPKWLKEKLRIRCEQAIKRLDESM